MDLLGSDISLDDVKNVPDSPEYSLSAILAEYGEAPAAASGVEARSREIVMEALGETISGAVRAEDAEGTEGLPSPPPRERAQKERSRRKKRQKHRSARPAAEDTYREEGAPPEQPPAPEPVSAPEPPESARTYEPAAEDTYEPERTYTPRAGRAYDPGPEPAAGRPYGQRRGAAAAVRAEDDDDGDVKVYRPAHAAPEGDEDVKIYSASVNERIADAERLSRRWAERASRDYAGGSYNDEDAFSAPAEDAGEASASGPEGAGDEAYAPDEREYREYSYIDGKDGDEYASAGEYRREYAPAAKSARSLPALLAALLLRIRGERGESPASAPTDEEDQGEEMPADEAAKYYAGNANSLKLRARLAFGVCVVMAWLALGLPAAGALGSDLRTASLVCLIMELSVVVLGLDVFTAGVMSLVRRRAGLWSLVSVACVASMADALVTYLMGEAGWGLPFCAAASFSMAFSLWGASLTSRGLRLSLKAAVLAVGPDILVPAPGVSEGETVIRRVKRPLAGYLWRCEEPDSAEWTYSALAPFLLGAALLLALLAAAATGLWTRFFRIFAALACVSAPCAALIACPLPFSLLARRVFRSGASVAGWAGARDIGRAAHIVVTDTDLFPRSTVSIDSIRILEGTSPESIIAAAGSIISASGSGLSELFVDLMRRNGCTMQRVEDFACHEGGGLRALINGSEVLCGSAGFMHLMSVRLPQKLASKSSVFVAVNGVLMGIFTIKYTPMTSVQEALSRLLRARREPLFAVRDFLVTPLMIRRRFRLPTDGFEFPPFEDRYRVTGTDTDECPPAALLSREGLASYAEVAMAARRAYAAGSFATGLSAASAVVGMLLVTVLTIALGLPPTGGALLTYSLLWCLPGALVSLASLEVEL
ncbi:MAG TPA: hypothetical protein IAC81_02965 [Candidatus Scatomorpha stercorigallinarum]|nr:hypothetical protein [Candidatus Scatomorpha stercorigallinarum]